MTRDRAPQLPLCWRCECQPCQCVDGWTVPDMQRAILHNGFLRAVRLMVPNVHLLMGGEQDMLEITSAGYAVEYEIKLTLSDYEADFRKTIGHSWRRDGPTKHAILAGAIEPGAWTLPRRFWFVMPMPLALRVQASLPEHVGLLAATPWRRAYPDQPNLRLARLKVAPAIRGARKLSDKLVLRAFVSLSARCWDLWKDKWAAGRFDLAQKCCNAKT